MPQPAWVGDRREGAAVTAAMRGGAVFLAVLCACGPAATESVAPAAEVSIVMEVERRLLAEVEDPARSGPISRPRVPRIVRAVDEVDRGIAATERRLGLASGDDEAVLLLELAMVYAERAFLSRATGEADTSDERALVLVRRLTSEARFDKFKRLDEAVLLLAEILERRGEFAAMQAAYLRLIGEFSGMYIPTAVLALADHSYAVGDIAAARGLYDKVLTFRDSPVYGYALYRRAWCDRTDSPALARAGLLRAIEAVDAGRGGTPAEARVVRAAARRDLERW